MDTSYITANLNLTLKLSVALPTPDGTNLSAAKLFIGFKNSLEALERYEIYVNSNNLYGQLHVGEESAIFCAGLNDMIKNGAPYVYTTYKNARKAHNNVCGVYVSFPNGYTANAPFTVTIPVKININQILPLASMKYLPSWMGRWEFEMYFHWKNLVVLPVAPEYVVNTTYFSNAEEAANYDNFTKSFTQIGHPITMPCRLGIADLTSVHLENIDNQILSFVEGEVSDVMYDQTTFQIQSTVNDALRTKYMQEPLIIPTNTLTFAKFGGGPVDNNNGTSFQATLSQCLENCDSVFLLFPFSNDQTTCFYQPYLRDVRLTLGEFGVHPSRYVRTWDDARYLAMCLDSLNLERSDISSLSADTARALLGNRKSYEFSMTPASHVNATNNVMVGDGSNFFMGISLSQVGFQSGCVSSPNTNIPFILEATLERTGLPGKSPVTRAGGAPVGRFYRLLNGFH
jgi:hypothetical protein